MSSIKSTSLELKQRGSPSAVRCLQTCTPRDNKNRKEATRGKMDRLVRKQSGGLAILVLAILCTYLTECQGNSSVATQPSQGTATRLTLGGSPAATQPSQGTAAPAATCECPTATAGPSWAVFGGSLAGTCVATLLVSFTCLYCAASKREKKNEYSGQRRKSQAHQARMQARERGLGGVLLGNPGSESCDDDARHETDCETSPSTTIPNGRAHGEFILASPALEPPKGSPAKVSPNVRKISAGMQPGVGNSPVTRRLVQLQSSASQHHSDSETSRPNSAVGTPGSNKPGRVGFSKERKTERKAYLASNELLGNRTPKSGAGTPTTPLAQFQRRIAGMPDDQAFMEIPVHLVVENNAAMADNTSDISLSMSPHDEREPEPKGNEQRLSMASRQVAVEIPETDTLSSPRDRSSTAPGDGVVIANDQLVTGEDLQLSSEHETQAGLEGNSSDADLTAPLSALQQHSDGQAQRRPSELNIAFHDD